jgi:hypothetical protein
MSKPRVWWINVGKIFASNIDSVASGFSSEAMARSHRLEGYETIKVVEFSSRDLITRAVIEVVVQNMKADAERWKTVHAQCDNDEGIAIENGVIAVCNDLLRLLDAKD